MSKETKEFIDQVDNLCADMLAVKDIITAVAHGAEGNAIPSSVVSSALFGAVGYMGDALSRLDEVSVKLEGACV